MNDKDLPTKRVSFSCNGHNRWVAEFEGQITRRDIRKLQRMIIVEFAKETRKRSAAKIREVMIKSTPPEKPNEPVTKELQKNVKSTIKRS